MKCLGMKFSGAAINTKLGTHKYHPNQKEISPNAHSCTTIKKGKSPILEFLNYLNL